MRSADSVDAVSCAEGTGHGAPFNAGIWRRNSWSMRVILKGNEPGLVAYYHFDEGNGTSSADVTGDANNAAKFVGTEMATWPMWVKSDIPGAWTCAP